jgi:hypothetical protein
MAPPVSLSEVDLHVIFTGVVSYFPGDGGNCNCVNEVRFMMPNGRAWRMSRNKPDVRIPPHVPFLIARERDVAFDDGPRFWKGKPPTGRLFNKWVYWILNDDNVRIENSPHTGVSFGNTQDVVHLADLCSEAGVSDECVRENTRKVAARVIMDAGRLSQRSLTADEFIFETCSGKTIGPKPIADEVLVSIKKLKLINGEIILKRLRLDDARSARTPIILKPHPQQRLIKIFFGSAPEADLGAVVGQMTNHDHGDTNVHFELYYDLSKRRPFPPMPIPERSPLVTGMTGPIGGGDRCPPTAGGKPGG